MTAQRSLDVSHLPEFDISNQAPLWWGQVCLAAIEGTMFCILIAMYFYIRQTMDVWPPPGTRVPSVVMPTLALLPLVLSCFGSYWASEGAKKNDAADMILGLSLNLLTAAIFVGMRVIAWNQLSFTWASDAHGSIVWNILALHTLDVVADLAFTAVLIVLLVTRRAGGMQRLGVHVDSIVWYFLSAIWIPLYVVIYWGPRFLAAP